MAIPQTTPKKKKIKVPQVVNGIDTIVEIEVEDTGGPTWGANNAHTHLNKDIPRIDAPLKVTGTAIYTFDVRLPGMLYGHIVTSPHASAKVKAIDVSGAEKIEGVKAVITLGEKTIRYEGEAIAAVAAITPEIAEDAARAIKVTYEKLPHAVNHKQATKPDAPQVFERVAGNVRQSGKRGDKAAAEAIYEQAEAKVSYEFLISMQHHACLETHGVTVDYRGGDTATVYASTQGTFTIPDEAAGSLGLKAQNVTAIVEHMGGGFGGKFGLDIPGDIACKLSKKAKAPVKLMLTRTQEFLLAGNRNGAWQKVKAGATKEGKLSVIIAEQYQLGGLGEGGLAGLPYIYQAGTVYQEMYALHTHQDGSRAMRAPGHPQASFAMEALMDDLAYKISMDPIEFRKKNTSDTAYHRQLDMGAKEIGWERRNKTPGGGTPYGTYKALKRGIGCGCATWGGGGYPVNQVDLFINSDGSTAVQVGSQDLGTGTRTYLAAVIAEEFGLPINMVKVRIGSSKFGNANPSGGSTTVASLAPAAKMAGYNARIQMFAKVAPVLGVKPDEISAKDGKIIVTANPEKSLTWKQACATLGPNGLSARGEWNNALAAGGVHGAQFAEVEVDTETGLVRILKMVGVQDCGLPLNRMAVRSQLNGGMIQALGYGLLEEHVTDEILGKMVNAAFDSYKIPGSLDMPEMVSLIDDGDTREAVIGMAEPAAIPGASAIANAVYNACGVRVSTLPVTPDVILKGLERATRRRS